MAFRAAAGEADAAATAGKGKGKAKAVDDDYEVPLSVKTNGLLAHRLYQLKSGSARYGRTLKDLLKRHWDEAAIYKELDRLEQLLEPHLGRTQRRATDAMDVLREFVEERRSDLAAEMSGGMPSWASTATTSGGPGRRGTRSCGKKASPATGTSTSRAK